MATRHTILMGLLVFALAVLLGGSPASAQKAMPHFPPQPQLAHYFHGENAHIVIPANDVPWRVESKALRLMHELDRKGYEVLRGYFKLYTTDECPLSYKVMNTCYGNNPAAPYVIPVVPPWPDHPGPGEWVDKATIGALGKTAHGYSATYRLDPHEAIVILAQMPPPASYFGQQTYLFTRAGELHKNSAQYDFISTNFPYLVPTFFTPVPHEPKHAPRVEIMADLSDANNNVVIQNQSHGVWEHLRYFVITPNPAMDAAIRGAFAKIGIDGHDIFTEKIPDHLIPQELQPDLNPADTALRFGLSRQADDFVTVIRYAMPVDDTAGDRWRQRLPLVVLRIRNLAADLQTYPWTGFEPRTPSDPPETWYNASPQNYLTTLAQAVCDRWNQACDQTNTIPFFNLPLVPFRLTGPECLPAWMNCLAPGEDSTYFFSGKLPLHENDVYAVVGPLGTATENATYVGLGLNSSLKQLGFDNISGDKLAGSAVGYTSDDVISNKFYVQYFARDCTGLESITGGYCYSIGDKLPDCYDVEDVGCDMLNLSLRGYIRPTTQRGTDPKSALDPVRILLKRPNP